MDPVLLQKQVRDNANELNIFLKDLKSWEKDMKRKDKELLEKTSDDTELPPVRSKIKRSKQTDAVNQSKVSKDIKRISSLDYSWDKSMAEACVDIDVKEKKEPSDSESNGEETDTECARLREQAMYEKELGNQHVKQQRWNEAIKCYTEAIRCNPYDAVFYANRALCYLKTSKSSLAETDCTTALQLDKTYVKAYQRRALARVNLGLKDDAKLDFQKVLELEPNNSAAKNELLKLEKLCGASIIKSKGKISHLESTKKEILNPKANQITCKKNVKEEKKVATCELEINDKKLCRTPTLLKAGGDSRSTEVARSTILESDKDISSLHKPPHLRSKVPLKVIPVEEVEKLTDLLQQHCGSAIKSDTGIVEINTNFSPKLQNPTNFPEQNKNTRNEVNVIDVKEKTNEENVKETTVKSQAARVLSKQPQTSNQITVLPAVPKTSVQFFASWKIVKNDRELKYQFLKQLSGNELPQLFQDSLESREFGEIIQCLAFEFLQRQDKVFSYLQGLSQVKRFSALVMFMSKTEKSVIRTLLNYCEKSGECSKEAIADLYKRYEIN